MDSKDIIDLKIEKTLYPLFGNLSEIIVETNRRKIDKNGLDEKEYARAISEEIRKFIKKFAGEELANKTYQELAKSLKFEMGE
ncbi:hypothetical protein AciM339_1574 [Aciduliprofundum sp. MAR08-339]|uniref:hypothetical protein n=1 Tax=Aciduliprofundum sp. (strain MAR08-339) TaxID=673860 RepID=UPI0002A4853D|nr:hypothetical protein AciM339_1574 [Aciduliprofundum sp. MAR08-339]